MLVSEDEAVGDPHHTGMLLSSLFQFGVFLMALSEQIAPLCAQQGIPACQLLQTPRDNVACFTDFLLTGWFCLQDSENIYCISPAFSYISLV